MHLNIHVPSNCAAFRDIAAQKTCIISKLTLRVANKVPAEVRPDNSTRRHFGVLLRISVI